MIRPCGAWGNTSHHFGDSRYITMRCAEGTANHITDLRLLATAIYITLYKPLVLCYNNDRKAEFRESSCFLSFMHARGQKSMQHKTVFLLLLVLLLFVAGCTSVDESARGNSAHFLDESEQTPPAIRILHAGGAYNGLTLLNAQEPFAYYYALGYRYFEYDLKLSSDGRLIGTHQFEHLPVQDESISYKAFTDLRLTGGLTPVNEEWLVQTLLAYPDLQIVVDAKMNTTEGDVAVLRRIEELEDIYGVDLSDRIIPEIFSIDMWEDVQLCTTFDRYFFSHYKEYYSVDTILEQFSSEKIWGIAVPVWSDSYICSELYKIPAAGKKLFVFTVTNEEELAFAQKVGAYGIYLDECDLPGLTDLPDLTGLSSPAGTS